MVAILLFYRYSIIVSEHIFIGEEVYNWQDIMVKYHLKTKLNELNKWVKQRPLLIRSQLLIPVRLLCLLLFKYLAGGFIYLSPFIS